MNRASYVPYHCDACGMNAAGYSLHTDTQGLDWHFCGSCKATAERIDAKRHRNGLAGAAAYR